MNENIDDPGFDPFEPEEDESDKAARTRRGGLAWLALLIAVLAAAGSAFLWWQDQQVASEEAALKGRLDALARQQTELGASLAAVQPRLSAAEQAAAGDDVEAVEQSQRALERRLEQLDRDLDELRADAQSMQAALFDLAQAQQGTQTAVAALARRGDTPGQALDMHQVESLLRMATERLQLFGDPQAADDALALAQERLAAMDDPVYLSVRQRIARAREALAAVELPDLVDIDGRLAAIQASIPRWPFAGDVAPAESEAPAGDDAGWWARLRHTMGGLVKVRRKLPEERTLTIADKDYLREGAWLQLETARLSLLRQSQAAYEQALARAEDTIRSHFAVQSPPVRTALERLSGLRQERIRADLPDISAPWSQLRLLRERAAPASVPIAPPAAPVEEPAVVEETAPLEEPAVPAETAPAGEPEPAAEEEPVRQGDSATDSDAGEGADGG